MRILASDRALAVPSLLDSRVYNTADEYARYVASLPSGAVVNDATRTQQFITDLIASSTYSAVGLAFGAFSATRDLSAPLNKLYSVGRNAAFVNSRTVSTAGASFVLNTGKFSFPVLSINNPNFQAQWDNFPVRDGNAFSVLMMVPSSAYEPGEGVQLDYTIGADRRTLLRSGGVSASIVDPSAGNAFVFPFGPPVASFAPQAATPPNMIATWHMDYEAKKLWTSISGQDTPAGSREYPNYPAPITGATTPTLILQNGAGAMSDLAEIIILNGSHSREQVAHLAQLRRSRYPA